MQIQQKLIQQQQQQPADAQQLAIPATEYFTENCESLKRAMQSSIANVNNLSNIMESYTGKKVRRSNEQQSDAECGMDNS